MRFLLTTLLLAAMACRSRLPNAAADLSMSPESWQSFAQSRPACSGVAAGDSGWTAWELDRPPGVLHLPSTAREIALVRRPDYREWMLPDSAGVEVWITEDPAMGMATTRPWKIQLETECRISVAQHMGVMFDFSAVKDGHIDTSYGATMHTVLARGLSFNALRAPSREERGALIGAISRVQLRR